MTRLSLALLLAMLASTSVAAPSWQERMLHNGQPTGMHRSAQKPSPQITLDEAVEQVRQETGGRILSARTVKREKRLVHRIKVLTREQQVRIVEVDAGPAN